VEMDENGDVVGQDPVDLLMHQPPNARWDDGFRPVDVSFDDCGRLLVSSDGTRGEGSKIVRIEGTMMPENTPSPMPVPVPTMAPQPTVTNPPVLPQRKVPPPAKCGSLAQLNGRGGAAAQAKDCGSRGGNPRRRIKGR
jgi:hypothetical protein